MAQGNADDDVFCRSCGESITKTTEICPNCGVRNSEYVGDDSTTAQADGSGHVQYGSQPHQSKSYDTGHSDEWWMGIGIGIGAFMTSFFLSTIIGGGVLTGLLTISGWVMIPIGIYYDLKWMRSNSQWNPSFFWVIVGAVPFVGIVAGSVYLYRRHELVGEP